MRNFLYHIDSLLYFFLHFSCVMIFVKVVLKSNFFKKILNRFIFETESSFIKK